MIKIAGRIEKRNCSLKEQIEIAKEEQEKSIASGRTGIHIEIYVHLFKSERGKEIFWDEYEKNKDFVNSILTELGMDLKKNPNGDWVLDTK